MLRTAEDPTRWSLTDGDLCVGNPEFVRSALRSRGVSVPEPPGTNVLNFTHDSVGGQRRVSVRLPSDLQHCHSHRSCIYLCIAPVRLPDLLDSLSTSQNLEEHIGGVECSLCVRPHHTHLRQTCGFCQGAGHDVFPNLCLVFGPCVRVFRFDFVCHASTRLP